MELAAKVGALRCILQTRDEAEEATSDVFEVAPLALILRQALALGCLVQMPSSVGCVAGVDLGCAALLGCRSSCAPASWWTHPSAPRLHPAALAAMPPHPPGSFRQLFLAFLLLASSPSGRAGRTHTIVNNIVDIQPMCTVLQGV